MIKSVEYGFVITASNFHEERKIAMKKVQSEELDRQRRWMQDNIDREQYSARLWASVKEDLFSWKGLSFFRIIF